MNQTYFPNYGYPPAYGAQARPVSFAAAPWYAAAQMQQNAPTAPAAASAPAFTVQPVTRKEEALAVIADPMSPGVLMPDLDHGVIYVKRFNMNTGTSDFAEFALQTPAAASQAAQEHAEPEVEYVTADEFKRVVEPLAREVAALRKRGVYDDE